MRGVILAVVAAALGVVVGVAVLAGAVAVGAGVMWMFVFGDDPWPDWSSAALLIPALTLAVGAGGATCWLVLRTPLGARRS